MKTLHLVSSAAAVALLAGSVALARPTIYGGGVIVDRDPNNDTIGSGLVFAVASTSFARAGVCAFSLTDEQDFFGMTITSPNTVITAMTVPLTGKLENSAVADTDLAIRDDAGAGIIAQDNDSGTDQVGSTENSNGSVVRAIAANPGPYSVEAFNVQTNNPGSYGLLVSAYTGEGLNFEEQEGNGGPAVALLLGLGLGGPMVGTGTISPSGDVDYYGVDIRRGEILAAVTTPIQGAPGVLNAPDTVLEVIGTNGATVLCSNDDAGTDSTPGNARGSAIRFRAPVDGRYFLRVRGFSGSTTGKYVLTAGLFAPPPGTECPWDLNSDGAINTIDLTQLLAKFGQPCP